MIKKLVNEGMNIARLNFSHGSYEEQGDRIKMVRNVSKELNKPIGILLDTKGPETVWATLRTEAWTFPKATKSPS